MVIYSSNHGDNSAGSQVLVQLYFKTFCFWVSNNLANNNLYEYSDFQSNMQQLIDFEGHDDYWPLAFTAIFSYGFVCEIRYNVFFWVNIYLCFWWEFIYFFFDLLVLIYLNLTVTTNHFNKQFANCWNLQRYLKYLVNYVDCDICSIQILMPFF